MNLGGILAALRGHPLVADLTLAVAGATAPPQTIRRPIPMTAAIEPPSHPSH